MKHTYTLTGMTCSSCEDKVRSALLQLDHITGVDISIPKAPGTRSVMITMDKHIPVSGLQKALDPKYRISSEHNEEPIDQSSKSWLKIYKPILLIFTYILLVISLVQFNQGFFDWMQWMRHFMAGFFLVFSFFKLLNLKGFAESYSMYDILAKRIKVWPYIYVLIELGLGLAYLLAFNSFVTNIIAFTLMSVSSAGILQSVLNKRKIKCACLGTVFNLPMSTITIIENGMMILMSGLMLWQLF
jgi:copper chaperone CopZ